AGIDVYAGAEAPTATPTFVPPPEAVQPRPLPKAEPAAPPVIRPAPPAATTPAPETAEPAPAAGGTSGVQIGAFSTPAIAEREYGQIVARYPSLTRGATRRVQEVTSSSGSTLYRTTVTGLSRDQATGLCTAIKSAGGDCIVR
ncbi:MAG: SPOR domain-containing protein, partial [Brevundimonas sp.]